MIENFRDVDWAIAYLCEGLEKHLDDERLSLAWYPHGHEMRSTSLVSLQRLRPTLGRLCDRYLAATVILDDGRCATPVAGICCRCDHPGASSCRCHSKQQCNRPIVSVIACVKGKQPRDQDRGMVLDWLHRELVKPTPHLHKVR